MMDQIESVSLILPESLGMENDPDDDLHHEESRNQNEIVELLLAAFNNDADVDISAEEYEEEDHEESLDTSSQSSHHSSSNENQLHNGDVHHHHNEQNRNIHKQPLFSTPAGASPPAMIAPTTDVRRTDLNNDDYRTMSAYPHHHQQQEQLFDDNMFNTDTNEEDTFNFNLNSNNNNNNTNHKGKVRYNGSQINNNSNGNNGIQYFDKTPAIDIDPLQEKFLYAKPDIQQISKLQILCTVKDRKIYELENRCEAYFEKYNSDLRALKHKNELAETAKHDYERRYESTNEKCNNLMHENMELQTNLTLLKTHIQKLDESKSELEKKLDESESLIDSLHRKINDLQRFEAISRTQQDCELVLTSMKEKHEHEIIALKEKLQVTQMNLQEKNVELDDLRAQLDVACKNNERAIFERMETINRLNQQLHECQRQYSDLLTNKSMENLNQSEMKRQLKRITDEKEKMEQTCQILQTEIRTLRERLGVTENDVNTELFGITNASIVEISGYILKFLHLNTCFLSRQVVPNDSHFLTGTLSDDNENGDEKTLLHSSNHVKNQKLSNETTTLINENCNLKKLIDEYASNEQHLIKLNEELHKRDDETMKIEDENKEQRAMIEQLMNEIQTLKKSIVQLTEKSDYEKQELKIIVEQLNSDNEQLRTDMRELDRTKELYINVCQEKNSIEDKLRLKYEQEIKLKLDELRKQSPNHEELEQYKLDIKNLREKNFELVTEKDIYLDEKSHYENIIDEKLKLNEALRNEHEILEKQLETIKNDLQQRITYLENDKQKEKLSHEKLINELKLEIDQLRINDEAKQNLHYVEKEFEQLKTDYYDLNLKQKELLNNLNTLENENQNLIKTTHLIEQEKLDIKETWKNDEMKIFDEMKQLHEQIDNLKKDLINKQNYIDNFRQQHVINEEHQELKQEFESLQIRISNYENAVSQYEEYRLKLENNLQKITQQRDTYKMDLRLMKDILQNKEQELTQIKLKLDGYERKINNQKENDNLQLENKEKYEQLEKRLEARYADEYKQMLTDNKESIQKIISEKEI
ncbi:unnamed protein product, partial [Didymodactylos carnosus]